MDSVGFILIHYLWLMIIILVYKHGITRVCLEKLMFYDTSVHVMFVRVYKNSLWLLELDCVEGVLNMLLQLEYVIVNSFNIF